MTPRISILCPTRGRPDWARRLLDSARATAAGEIELVFYADSDEPRMTEYADQIGGSDVNFIVGPRVVLSECWNRCAEKATGDVLMQCGDDIIFRTIDWDTRVLAEFDQVPDKILLVHGEDGIQHEGVATHGFLHRTWMEVVGYFVPPLFASDYNDLWLTEVANALDRKRYLPDVYTEHMHPVAGKGPMDQTHQERMARHRTEDCDAIWRNTADQRAVDATKLRRWIDDFQAIWSSPVYDHESDRVPGQVRSTTDGAGGV